MRLSTCCACAFTLLVVAASVHAQPQLDAAARARAIAPFVEEETVAVVHVDVSRTAVESLFDLFSPIMSALSDSDRTKRDLATQRDAWLQAGLKDFYVVISLGDENVFPRMQFVTPIPPGMNEDTLRSAIQPWSRDGQVVEGAFVSRPMVLPGGRPREWRKFRPVERPELAAAFEAAGDTAAQLILIPPRDTRRVIEEIMPEFPKQFGGGPSTVLTHGVSWAAVGIDCPPHASLRLVVRSADAPAAESLRAKLADVLRLVGQRKEVLSLVPKFDDLAALLMPKVEGDRLVVVLDEQNRGIDKCLAALAPPVEAMHARTVELQSINNLKQIGLAMLNYHAAKKHFPTPAGKSPDGKPLLSWRVYLLPYLNHDELFKQFHLDEPWDSPHNRTLIDKMPAIYRLPISKSEAGRTNYLLPVGNGALFDADKPTALQEVKDGTSNTIMVVEVDDEHAAIWTKPDDWEFDPTDPFKGLGRFFDGGFNAVFCDGSATLFEWSQAPKDIGRLRALFTRAGGEVVPQ